MTLLDWLFPKLCLACGRRGDYLCRFCRQTIPQIKIQRCPICDRPNLSGLTHGCCASKLKIDGLLSLFPYCSLAGKALKEFKYYQVRDLKQLLVDLVVSGLKEKDLSFFWRKNNFVFTSIPLFPIRRLWRGFDQSREILKGVCDRLAFPFEEEVLRRRKWTREQAKLEAEKRRRNVAGAFKLVDRRKVKNKKMVVFDDVWTTGSTLKEAAKTLKRAGAIQVWGLTLCR